VNVCVYYTFVYCIYIYMCVCVCVRVLADGVIVRASFDLPATTTRPLLPPSLR
jgi:hypothetical protein